MKSLILSLILLAACLTNSTEAEARPHLLRRAVAWKRDHRPVVRFFQNRQPVRRVVRWKRAHTPVRNLLSAVVR